MSYTLTVRIDLMLAEEIAVLARQTNQPVSAVVREALSRHVAETQAQAPRATTLLRAAGSLRGESVSATNENVRAKLRARRAKR